MTRWDDLDDDRSFDDDFFGRRSEATTVVSAAGRTRRGTGGSDRSTSERAEPGTDRRAGGRATRRGDGRGRVPGREADRSSRGERSNRRSLDLVTDQPRRTWRELLPMRGTRVRPADVGRRESERRSAVRIAVFIGVVVCLFAVVVLKLVDVQFNQRQYWETFGADSRRAKDEIRVDRGTIFDRNGHALALSVYRPNVVADPTEVKDKAGLAKRLAPILEVPEAKLVEKLSKTKSRYQLLARNVDTDVMDALVTKGRQTPTGIYYEYASIREYPSGNLARAIVGRTYDDGAVDQQGRAGRSGMEAKLDTALSGEPGWTIYEKDRQGGSIAGTDVLVHEPTPGENVYLTIDQGLQYATEQELTNQLEKMGATEATAIIMKPSTGEILAMVTVAHDENGKVSATTDNRAATTVYEPGSVTKMMTIAGAIEDGQVGPETQRRVPDHLQMANKTFRDHDTHPTELWTTTDILSNSSNIGTIQIAQALGAPKLDRYLRSFGLGQATGSDIPGEVKGLLPAVGTWSGTSLGSIAIGQTVAVTPLQLLAAYNTIDNGGIYVAPHVIGSTDRGNGKQATVQPTSRRVVSEKTASAVEAMLAKVVADGTGKEAVVPGYVAYGKTGTARIPQANPTDPTDGYLTPEGTYQYASTFIGGIRGADLTMVVTLKDPKTVTTGGEAAAPVFGQLAALALRTLKIPPQVVGADPLAEVPELSPSAKADVAGNPTSGDDGTQG